jgi:hypothetical protein
MSPESLGIDIYGFMAIQGAIACVIAGLVALWIVMWVVQNWLEARTYRRLERAVGGKAEALATIAVLEADREIRFKHLLRVV